MLNDVTRPSEFTLHSRAEYTIIQADCQDYILRSKDVQCVACARMYARTHTHTYISETCQKALLCAVR